MATKKKIKIQLEEDVLQAILNQKKVGESYSDVLRRILKVK
jgi:negative regulator of replication initiation